MPEKKLLAAILERAIIDATGKAKDIPIDERTLARIWLKDNSIARWSFSWVCDNLGLDGEIVRRFVWQADTKPINLNCNKKKNTLPSDHAIRIRRRRVASQLPPKPRRRRSFDRLDSEPVQAYPFYEQLDLPLGLDFTENLNSGRGRNGVNRPTPLNNHVTRVDTYSEAAGHQPTHQVATSPSGANVAGREEIQPINATGCSLDTQGARDSDWSAWLRGK